MSLFITLSNLEENRKYHLGRLLVLLLEFSKKSNAKEIEGLTKLAKLDFLLRYPQYLEKALLAVKKINTFVKIRDHEKTSVESKMVRFKYGPWDHRYREFINLLVGLDLVYLRLESRTYRIGLTIKGIEIAETLALSVEFNDLDERAKLLRKNFDWNGTRLKDFIYETFPEIGNMQYGEQIL
jgi:hypothetical protein